jgi:TetR/AcrR family transcriptional regulator, cholesterol catabolism regulator
LGSASLCLKGNSTIARRKHLEQHQRRTEQIVTTSAQLIQEKGFHGTTLQEVAEELDVTKAALYYYVKDKEDLLFRIYQHTLELALASVEAIVQSEQPPAEKVRALIDNQVRLITSRPELFTVYFHEKAHLSAEHGEVATRLERQIVQRVAMVLREGIASGAFQDIDTTVAAFSVLGASSWVYRWYRPGGRLSVGEVSTILQRVILSGLEQGQA